MKQVTADPASAPWYVRAVIAESDGGFLQCGEQCDDEDGLELVLGRAP